MLRGVGLDPAILHNRSSSNHEPHIQFSEYGTTEYHLPFINTHDLHFKRQRAPADREVNENDCDYQGRVPTSLSHR